MRSGNYPSVTLRLVTRTRADGRHQLGPAWTRPWPPCASATPWWWPKLDRLARSVPDARDIGDTLVACGVRLSLGGAIYDPADPMSKMFFNMLAVFA
jgi:hypothetical protein